MTKKEDSVGYLPLSQKRSTSSNSHFLKRAFQALFFLFLLFNIANLLSLVPFGKNEEFRGLNNNGPLVIAHRGSSGMRPEHTIASYELAVKQGADIIECDVGITKDLKLVCSHDLGINRTTDVHQHPEFHDRIQTYEVENITITDYFLVDFTLEELMTLRKVEYRPYRNQEFNGHFKFATFDDYVGVAQNSPRTVGIYPETKNPDFYNAKLRERGVKLTMEDMLLAALNDFGYTEADSPCLLQSFSVDSLQYMSKLTKLRLVWLRRETMTESEILQASSLCYGIGVNKNLIIQVDPVRNKINGFTSLVDHAHSLGLKVHVFTFRNEGLFLAWDYGTDPYMEMEQFYRAGADGFFTDFTASLVNYLKNVDAQYQSSYMQRFSSYLCSE